MRKKLLSLALALALCLGLTVPAMAAGEVGSTTIQDDGGFSYTLSKPVVGTRVIDGLGLFYQITEGTIITPVLPEGTVKEDVKGDDYYDYYMGGRLVYKLPNGGGVVRYYVADVYDTPYGPDVSSFGDLEGVLYNEATPTQPLLATPTRPLALGDGRYCIERHFFENVGPYASGSSDLYLEVVPDKGSTTPVEPEKPAEVKTANPTNDKLEVNGAAQDPTVYKIGGSNYFKIRDVAAVLNGTEKQFAVGYAGGKVTVTSGQAYEATGKELAGPPAAAKDAASSNDAIVIDGVETDVTVYKIGGSNYFKLRDLGKALNFYVGWEAGRGIYIETDKPYSE